VRHIRSLSKELKRPALATTQLAVKTAYVELWAGVIDLFSGVVALVGDLRSEADGGE
jgi:hypothetical protein